LLVCKLFSKLVSKVAKAVWSVTRCHKLSQQHPTYPTASNSFILLAKFGGPVQGWDSCGTAENLCLILPFLDMFGKEGHGAN
jgi:hypothetical protein